MEHIEHTAITTFHTPPSLWLRYVDDTVCILSKDHIDGFHTHLNSICSHIQLTIEKEHSFSPPFLDVLIKRESRHRSITMHSFLSTTVFSKSTHHQQISSLHVTSTQTSEKLSVAKTLLGRVNAYITNRTQKHSELQKICIILRLNGFPTKTTFHTSRQSRSQNLQSFHFCFFYTRHIGKSQKNSK